MQVRTGRNGPRLLSPALVLAAASPLLYLLSAGPADWALERLPFDYDHPVSQGCRAFYAPVEWAAERVPAYRSYLDSW